MYIIIKFDSALLFLHQTRLNTSQMVRKSLLPLLGLRIIRRAPRPQQLHLAKKSRVMRRTLQLQMAKWWKQRPTDRRRINGKLPRRPWRGWKSSSKYCCPSQSLGWIQGGPSSSTSVKSIYIVAPLSLLTTTPHYLLFQMLAGFFFQIALICMFTLFYHSLSF